MFVIFEFVGPPNPKHSMIRGGMYSLRGKKDQRKGTLKFKIRSITTATTTKNMNTTTFPDSWGDLWKSIRSTSRLWGIPKVRFTSSKTQRDQNSKHHHAYNRIGITHCVNVPYSLHITITSWPIHHISSVGVWTMYRRHPVVICKCSWFNNGAEGN